MINTTLSTIFSCSAIPFVIWRSQLAIRHHILFAASITGSLISASYYFQGALQGAIVVLFSVLITLTQGQLGRLDHKINSGYTRFGLSVIGILGGLTIAPPLTGIETLPFMAFCISKLAERNLNVVRLKSEQLISMGVWLAYAIMVGNIGMVALNSLVIVSVVYWLYKVGLQKSAPNITT
jgi:hypothetical protein